MSAADRDREPVIGPRAVTVAESHAYCGEATRRHARNFYYSFAILPPPKRAAMCAIYALMRYTDDLSDSPLARDPAGALEDWRAAVRRAYAGDVAGNAVLPAFHETVARYGIEERLFEDLIDGVEMDLTTTRYSTFDDLYRYCYRVASVVGLVCLRVWGVTDTARANELGEACGIAFQLTNILRDVREDAERGRVYLPQEDLALFDCTAEGILAFAPGEGFGRLMAFEAERAAAYYERARPLDSLVLEDSRPAFRVMYRIYRALLDEVRRTGDGVLSRRARVPASRKAGIVAAEWLRGRLGPAGAR
ncbi:MAG: phytoene/squalene synthase family protein [Chthonomonadales bacterium]|nr:phytoene/squalene synthase family protein [Chthonomonadales bacterium]